MVPTVLQVLTATADNRYRNKEQRELVLELELEVWTTPGQRLSAWTANLQGRASNQIRLTSLVPQWEPGRNFNG